MPDWILLLPLGLPLLGALTFPFFIPRLTARARHALAIGFLVVEIILLLVNIAPSSHRLVITTWERAALTWAWQMDGVTQIIVLTMFVLLLALWLVAPPRLDSLTLLVLAAALLFAAADGLAMTLVAWTLLDLALFGWRWAREIERATAFHSLALGLLAGLLFFAGALTARTDTGAILLALALWARAGLFPFHRLLPSRGIDEFDVWFARAVPTLAAANAWLHWSAFQTSAPLMLIGILASAHIIFATLWTWRADNATHALAIGASYAFALVPLTIAFGGDAGVALALWQTLAIIGTLALGELATRWRAENRNYYPRLLWVLALLALAGLPLTPAFLGRLGLYVTLTESGEWLLLVIVFTTTVGMFAPLWHWLRALKGSETREPTRGEYAGLLIALLAFAALALTPPWLAPALGIGEAAERALDRVIRTNNAFGVLIGAVVLLAPIVGAFFLRAFARERPHARSLVARLARLGDGEWAERVVIRLGARLGVLTRDAFTLTEENPTVWILLAALWVAIFIAIAR